jgi:hypothetical protein
MRELAGPKAAQRTRSDERQFTNIHLNRLSPLGLRNAASFRPRETQQVRFLGLTSCLGRPQDGFTPGTPGGGHVRGIGRARRSPRSRQVDGHARALSNFAADIDRATGLMNEAVNL